MLGWVLAVVALAALLFDPGVVGMTVVAVAILLYLIVRARSWAGREDPPGDG